MFGILNVSGGAGGDSGSASEEISAHNNDKKAHPAILGRLDDLQDRVLAVEIAAGAEVTSNPFAVTFGNLSGVKADGLWNEASSRLEF